MIGGSLDFVNQYDKRWEDDSIGGSSSGDSDDDEDATSDDINGLLVDQEALLRKQQDEQELVIIRRTRCMTLTAICSIAFILGHIVFFHIKESEIANFDKTFKIVSQQMFTGSHKRWEQIWDASSIFSQAYLDAEYENLPFVTLSQFLLRAADLQRVTGARHVIYSPFLHSENQREEWEIYSMENQGWIESPDLISPNIWSFDDNGTSVVDDGPPPYSPIWQTSPLPTNDSIINFNLRRYPFFEEAMNAAMLDGMVTLSKPFDLSNGTVLSLFADSSPDSEEPCSVLLQPITVSWQMEEVVAGISLSLVWTEFFGEILRGGEDNVQLVVDSCGETATYLIQGQDCVFVGWGDHHDPAYAKMGVATSLVEASGEHSCNHLLYAYPTRAMENSFRSDDSTIYTAIVGAMFFVAILLFITYDRFINKRAHRVEKEANKTEAIVSQLFPGKMRNMILGQDEALDTSAYDSTVRFDDAGEHGKHGFGGTGLMADFFPETTILCADIDGFLAWSSTREPVQVFELLETLFHSLDNEAKVRKVFKVETVGNLYVAAAGVPAYRKNHAAVMARFARACIRTSIRVFQKLETKFGPDTSDMSLRVSLHSGAVTAGVLRGERARFQLFGDTMNTTTALLSTCSPNRVVLSKQAAEFLEASGKKKWLEARADTLDGLKIFYLTMVRGKASEVSSSGGSTCFDERDDHISSDDESILGDSELPAPLLPESSLNSRTLRLIKWNSDLLIKLLKRVMARRAAENRPIVREVVNDELDSKGAKIGLNRLPVHEVVEVIDMPTKAEAINAESVELEAKVVDQINKFVTFVASMYSENPFHNFEHASHVILSVNKLLNRIVAPKLQMTSESNREEQREALLHDHTYGITSDPMTQFACVLVALIHDCDHRGIPNFLLAHEDSALFSHYQGKSVAEQNSIDLAWDTLFQGDFADFRACIFTTEEELQRFRQLVVNCLIATDIFDKDQTTMRKARWEKAFALHENVSERLQEDINRKATIVIEHIIQASDVSHTMQHWDIYKSWNKRLFCEGYDAYLQGRAEKDPSPGWYQGELWFFDNYIIPLAKKLETCGVFGVSSDEFLTYARANRQKWEDIGGSIVEAWVAEYKQRTG